MMTPNFQPNSAINTHHLPPSSSFISTVETLQQNTMMTPQTHHLPSSSSSFTHTLNSNDNNLPSKELIPFNHQEDNVSYHAQPYVNYQENTMKSPQIQLNLVAIDTTFNYQLPSSTLSHQEHVSFDHTQPYETSQEHTIVNNPMPPQVYETWQDPTMFTHRYSPSSSSSSTLTSTSSPTNDLLMSQSMCFKPTIECIFNFLIPTRFFYGQQAQELGSCEDVMEIDLYSSGKLPEEIFGGSKEKEFYFFTKLVEKVKGSNKRMKREIEGKGTWSSIGAQIPQALEIQGQTYDVGTKRQFKFIYDENNDACKDDSISYIMHEYVAYQVFLEYKANQMNIHNYDFNNIEKIAFFHVYKKVEKHAKSTTCDKRKLDWPLPAEKKKTRTNDGSTIDNDVSFLDVLYDCGLDNINVDDYDLPDDIKVNGIYLDALINLDWRDIIEVLDGSESKIRVIIEDRSGVE